MIPEGVDWDLRMNIMYCFALLQLQPPNSGHPKYFCLDELPHLPKNLLGARGVMADVVRLNGDLLDLAVLCNDRVPLASVRAQHGGGGELEVPRAAEGSVRVAEEADAGGLVGVEGLPPRVHADEVSAGLSLLGMEERGGVMGRLGMAYTKASLTEMTNTFPACLSLGWAM